MKIKRLLLAAFVGAIGLSQAHAQQPYNGCYFPCDILNWSPETDFNAKFNRSTVPYAQRFVEPQLMKANENQYYEGQLCNATNFFNMCSVPPSQGDNSFTGYQPTYWQYMDLAIFWAGASNEGFICPPPAYSIDAAHMNGVKILGQIFLAPAAFGGKDEWDRELVRQENGVPVYAKKLYEIAKYFGFDGWFINEETKGVGSGSWATVIQEYMKLAEADGLGYHEFQWYNAGLFPEYVVVDCHPNVSQFLEYSFATAESYANYTKHWGNKQFKKVYYGTGMSAKGTTGASDDVDANYPRTGHIGSMDLFCPEEKLWKDPVRNLLGTADECGEKAYAAQASVFKNEETMWVNRKADPSYVAPSGWRGFSGALLERSAIQSLPFESSFSVGLGKHRFVNGEKRGTQDWNHSGMQSILPTWRWWIEDRASNFKVVPDWDEAWNCGTSFLFTGKLTKGDHLMRMYKTMIPVGEDGGTFKLVYKTSRANSVQVKLFTDSDVNATPVTLTRSSTKKENGWTVDEYSLAPVAGKTVYIIALNLKATAAVSSYSLRLGYLGIFPAGYQPQEVTVANFRQTNSLGYKKGDIRLMWDFTPNADFDHFDIYTITSESTSLVGQTRGEAFFIPTFARTGTDASVAVKLVPVMKGGVEGTPSEINCPWASPAEKVVMKPSRSYAKVGEEIVIKARSLDGYSDFKWQLPENLEMVSGDGTSEIKVRCKSAGALDVKVTDGVNAVSKPIVTVMEQSAFDAVANVAVNGSICAYRGSTDVMTPAWIIDGKTVPDNNSERWYRIGTNMSATVDLGNMYKIYGFRIHDAQSNTKARTGDNFGDYTIEISADGKEWNTPVDEEGRWSDNIKEDYIAPSMARYVRISPNADDDVRQYLTMVIWEFEVLGTATSNLAIEAPASLTVAPDATATIEVSYDLNGEQRAADFGCRATSDKLAVGEITEDAAAGKFIVSFKAPESIGEATLNIRVTNGGDYRDANVAVTIDTDDSENVLNGLPAVIRQYEADYKPAVSFKETTVSTLTDGDRVTDGLLSLENFASFRDDTWAVFEASGSWNLAKVKIYIPNGNEGVDDNDEPGLVNQDVSIRVSDDGMYWNEVKRFESIGKVSELQYIFPDPVKAKYLAVVCNLKALFYPSLAEVEAFTAKSTSSLETVFTDTARTLDVSPNPVSTGDNVRFEVAGDADITLVSLGGVVMDTARAADGPVTYGIDVPAGFYILCVKDATGIRTEKLIVR
ncbi:discoidin domain-containing protein [uncultured Muribaculum sp.]|uniref:endo-beta-N-acetylglucosaminidase n=1 Tax=uncultured Muribaculum sp. TaxID=1918613 RepID=UPI0025EC602F|nr:discoidin domain-containing protein [uncultured Muribaculum sp.]